MRGGDVGPSLPHLPSPDRSTSFHGGDSKEEDQVMSEVHLGCPPNFSGPYISHFTFALPPEVELTERKYDVVTKGKPTSMQQAVSFDEDGDLVLTRRSKEPSYNFTITIQHNITSTIPSVGLQVWRAELVLADFVMHKMFSSSDLDRIVAVELGAGTGNDSVILSLPGLVGMLLARVAKTVFLTDHGDEVLENCAKNVHLNSGPFPATVYVRELDWMASWPPPQEQSSASRGRFSWISSELEEFQRASFLFAADVIYSDDLTDAFFSTLETLMSQSPNKLLYLALEKRYNFTLEDLNVVANGYSHFRSYMRDGRECEEVENGSFGCFVGTCIDLTQIPQYTREYDRGDDVEIWQIKYEKKQP